MSYGQNDFLRYPCEAEQYAPKKINVEAKTLRAQWLCRLPAKSHIHPKSLMSHVQQLDIRGSLGAQANASPARPSDPVPRLGVACGGPQLRRPRELLRDLAHWVSLGVGWGRRETGPFHGFLFWRQTQIHCLLGGILFPTAQTKKLSKFDCPMTQPKHWQNTSSNQESCFKRGPFGGHVSGTVEEVPILPQT